MNDLLDDYMSTRIFYQFHASVRLLYECCNKKKIISVTQLRVNNESNRISRSFLVSDVVY